MENINADIRRPEYLLDDLEIYNDGSSAIIKLPFFFPGSGGRLELTAAEFNGSVYISDSGAAYRELSSRTRDTYVLENVFEYLAGVYLNIKPTKQKAIVWAVSPSDMRRFYRVLQCVSLCANADLYPIVDEEKLKECSRFIDSFEYPESRSYPSAFVESLRSSLIRKGNMILTPFAFSGETSPMRILTEEKNNGRLSLTDAGDFDGGDLIECIKWNNHDDYRQFDPIITGVCDRFNAGYDGFKVRYIIEKESRISLPEAVFTLMQVMSILGELGITIKR